MPGPLGLCTLTGEMLPEALLCFTVTRGDEALASQLSQRRTQRHPVPGSHAVTVVCFPGLRFRVILAS